VTINYILPLRKIVESSHQLSDNKLHTATAKDSRNAKMWTERQSKPDTTRVTHLHVHIYVYVFTFFFPSSDVKLRVPQPTGVDIWSEERNRKYSVSPFLAIQWGFRSTCSDSASFDVRVCFSELREPNDAVWDLSGPKYSETTKLVTALIKYCVNLFYKMSWKKS
jgi:hypothetical protein